MWPPNGRRGLLPMGSRSARRTSAYRHKVTGTVHFPQRHHRQNLMGMDLHTERTLGNQAQQRRRLHVHGLQHPQWRLPRCGRGVRCRQSQGIARKGTGNHLKDLKQVEYKQQQRWLDKQRFAARARLVFWIVSIVLGIALCAWGIWAVISSNRRAQLVASNTGATSPASVRLRSPSDSRGRSVDAPIR